MRFLVRCCTLNPNPNALRRRLLVLAHRRHLRAASCKGRGQGSTGCAAQAMRCAGFDKVDLEAAARVGIRVARVPTCAVLPCAPMQNPGPTRIQQGFVGNTRASQYSTVTYCS